MSFLDAAATAVGAVADEIASDLLGLGEQIYSQFHDRNEARIPLESSAFSELLYRRDRTLTIVFRDGSRYAIPDFPAVELARWLAAPSAGAYFNRFIRGRY